MTDIAIRVGNLSKRYRIGAREKRANTLRERLGNLVASPFDYLRSTLRGPTEEEIIWALKEVSFEVKEGEVVGIIGRNGAGKTTLLRILSRITEPTEGRASINGRVASLLEVGTGFHPELTGRENIYMNGAILGMRKAEIERKFEEIVDFSGVEKFIDTPVKRYSSGMYVRLAFAVAAHLEPEILLVDEVLAVGDAEFRKKCLGKMESVAGEGRTVLFVSHNMASISSLCNRTILLCQGEIVEDGDTLNVIQKYLDVTVQSSAIVNKADIDKLKEEKLFAGARLFEIHEVSILDKDGNPRLDYNSTEEINVKIRFKCLQEVMNFRLGVYVSMAMGIHIMSSLFSDDERLVHHTNLKPGEYTWVCKIPPNIFGHNQYYFTIGMLEHTVHHLKLRNIFRINVNFIGYNNVIGVVNEPSPFKPKFKWVEM